ncbi:hypothetical protein B0J14DRAFT_663192 [Halenospora varia]|nr:hypothetical protein B0J14DRAFT_663192 [Halenospora varia]
MLQNASRSPSDSISPTGIARAVLGPREGAPPSHHDQRPPSALREITQPEDTPVIDLQSASEVLDFGYERVLQLFETFTQEVYVVCPCIGLDFAMDKIEAMLGPQSPFTNGETVILGLDLIDLEILKVTLAIGMLIQDDSGHPWSSKLEEHLIWNVETNMKQEVPHIEDIMATLMTIYFILQDQAAKAWRISGVAVKACLELGLHKERPNETRDNRLPTYDFLQDLFSCVYDLDKRCSFDMGLPSALHDKDIDDWVLNMDGRHPFLLTMVKLNLIHSDVVEHHNSMSKCGGKETDERAEFLEFQIQKLMESAREIQLFPPESKVLPSPATQRTMETFITLRTTQIKMLTQVRSLSSSQALSGRPQRAHALISRAIFTVETHAKLISAVGYREVARLFRSMMDRFLMESVSCMLLAASYSPKAYGVMCRNAFHTALDILGQSPHRQRGQNCDAFNSLDDLRRKGETMQMPPLERPFPTVITSDGYSEPTQIPQIQQTSTGTDFFPPCEQADLDFFPAPGEMNSSWELPLNSFGFFNNRAALFTL